MTQKTWMFYNPITRERLEIDHPEEHPDFMGWETKKKGSRVTSRKPKLLLNNEILIIGIRQNKSQYSTAQCTTGCKRAKPWTPCTCSCCGKNHGIHYIGPKPITNEDIEEEFDD